MLALRAAGVPARYATGCSAGEYSRLEGCLIARARHAPAWALASIDGRWRPVDTIPSGWLAAEADRASRLAPALDAFRCAALRPGRWRREWDGRLPAPRVGEVIAVRPTGYPASRVDRGRRGGVDADGGL